MWSKVLIQSFVFNVLQLLQLQHPSSKFCQLESNCRHQIHSCEDKQQNHEPCSFVMNLRSETKWTQWNFHKPWHGFYLIVREFLNTNNSKRATELVCEVMGSRFGAGNVSMVVRGFAHQRKAFRWICVAKTGGDETHSTISRNEECAAVVHEKKVRWNRTGCNAREISTMLENAIRRRGGKGGFGTCSDGSRLLRPPRLSTSGLKYSPPPTHPNVP